MSPPPVRADMGGPLAWMVSHPVAANLLMIAIVIGGLISVSGITQEVFPEYELDIITISVAYPGTSPEEVEQGALLPLEEELRSLDFMDRLSGVAYEGRASVTIELIKGTDANKALADVKSAVDRITSFADDVERPVVSMQSRRREVLRLALAADVDERTLYELALRVEDELLALDGITQVEVRGLREPEISIEIPRGELEAHGLTLRDVASRVGMLSQDIPGGWISSEAGEILLRTRERRETGDEFAALPLITTTDGTSITLGEIASIREGFTATTEREAYYNGRRAALISVYRTGDQTPQGVSRTVHEYAASLRGELPPGFTVAVTNDRSELYSDRMNLLLKNGSMGLALVLVSLGLLLEPRLAFWVAMGMPISIIGSFIIIKGIGGTVNMVSLFAFIVTLGIIVDDAVVVGENVYYYRSDPSLTPLEATVKGVREMAAPVFVSVATNILGFIPLLFVSGSTGQFYAIMPVVVISVFAISLLESLLVLPAHLNYGREGRLDGLLSGLTRLSDACSRGLELFVERVYFRGIKAALGARYLVLVFALAVLAVAYAYWSNGWIDFSFRSSIQTDNVDVEIELPYGAPVSEVRRIARLVEAAGHRVLEDVGEPGILKHAMTDIGRNGSNTAEVSMELVPQDERSITTREFSERWREVVGDVPGVERLFFDYLSGPGGSAAISVELTHRDPREIELAASELALALGEFAGVTDMDDGFARGKPQMDFRLLPEGRAVGLTASTVGRQVRDAFYGAEALSLQRGKDEMKVMVRLPGDERGSVEDLRGMLLRAGETLIPLQRAAGIEEGRAYTQINRVDGRRVLTVTASVIPGMANENKVLDSLKADFLPELVARHPGLGYSFQGRQREQNNALSDLLKGMLFVLPAIFCMLAILFGSYVLALLVMISIPFGLVSAMLGHILMGYDLSIISVFGMIALCGIVINGGVVFTVTANRYMQEGRSPMDAACEAAIRRFRPIVLTAVTTFFGLAPMIFEPSVQARFLIPMAISLGYGILFTTAVILILMPVLYVIRFDLGGHGPGDSLG